MKLKGKKLSGGKSKTLSVTLDGEAVELLLKAVPPGFNERIKSYGLFQIPPRPQRAKKFDNGVEQRVNGQPVMVDDKESPAWQEYEAALNSAVNRRLALTLAQGLRESVLTFEAEQPAGNEPEAWAAYADALVKELFDPEAGLTDREIVYLADEIESLDNRFDLEERAKDFLAKDT